MHKYVNQHSDLIIKVLEHTCSYIFVTFQHLWSCKAASQVFILVVCEQQNIPIALSAMFTLPPLNNQDIQNQ